MKEVTLERVIACTDYEEQTALHFGNLVPHICDYMQDNFGTIQDCGECPYRTFCGQNGLDIVEEMVRHFANDTEIEIRTISESEVPGT